MKYDCPLFCTLAVERAYKLNLFLWQGQATLTGTTKHACMSAVVACCVMGAELVVIVMHIILHIKGGAPLNLPVQLC